MFCHLSHEILGIIGCFFNVIYIKSSLVDIYLITTGRRRKNIIWSCGEIAGGWLLILMTSSFVSYIGKQLKIFEILSS